MTIHLVINYDISPELEIDLAILTNDFTKKKSIFSTICNKTTVSYSATDKLTLKGILKLKAKFLNTNTFLFHLHMIH